MEVKRSNNLRSEGVNEWLLRRTASSFGMDQCFVMQPFDEGKFDKRYEDTIKPAIKSAGLKPYRVDEDPSSEVLMETVEEEIARSRVCVAEITTNNPNVWYELGLAHALGISVVMICSSERNGGFPFDVSHRKIINYETGSKSDFDRLKNKISKSLEAKKENKK